MAAKRGAGKPNAIGQALVGLQTCIKSSSWATGKSIRRWHYFSPFFPEFNQNNNPEPLVTNPYTSLSRAALATRGLGFSRADVPASKVLGCISAGLSDPTYRAVVTDMRRRDGTAIAAYGTLADELAQAFAEEGYAERDVEAFRATAQALLGARGAAGFAEAFLTLVIGCCIAEPGAYILELFDICELDPDVYQQVFGTVSVADAGEVRAVRIDTGGEPGFTLEIGRFVSVGTDSRNDGAGTRESEGAPYYLPSAERAVRHVAFASPAATEGEDPEAEAIPETVPAFDLTIGRHPEEDGVNLALGDDDRCVSMEHFVLHVRGREVRIEDWSTCGTVVLRQSGGDADLEELRLGAFVGQKVGQKGRRELSPPNSLGFEGRDNADVERFVGHKALGRRMAPDKMLPLRDGDLIVPAPRYRGDGGAAPRLDPLACPTVVRFTVTG